MPPPPAPAASFCLLQPQSRRQSSWLRKNPPPEAVKTPAPRVPEGPARVTPPNRQSSSPDKTPVSLDKGPPFPHPPPNPPASGTPQAVEESGKLQDLHDSPASSSVQNSSSSHSVTLETSQVMDLCRAPGSVGVCALVVRGPLLGRGLGVGGHFRGGRWKAPGIVMVSSDHRGLWELGGGGD